MEHESDGYTNCNLCARYSHQRIGAGTGGLRNKRMSGDHPNYSIIEISQNTKKSPGDLRRFAVIQDPSGKSSANAGMKNSQINKIIIIIKRTCPTMDFAIPVDHRVKIKKMKNVLSTWTLLEN